MMAASLKEGDEVVDLLLNKGADVNYKSQSMRERPFKSES